MSSRPPLTSEDWLLAAELAFGLLDAEAAFEAELRVDRDPAFATAVARWRDHLATWAPTSVAEDARPRETVWRAISKSLGALTDDDELPALRRSVRRWRAAAGGLTALAAALVAMLLVRPAHEPVPAAPPSAKTAAAQVVALLDAGADASLGTVTYDLGTHRLTVRLRYHAEDRRVPELWVIGADGIPRSLGVVPTPTSWSRVLPLGQGSLVAPGAKIAVSLEPQGGSPLSKPTGPVIMSGDLT